MGQQIRFCTTSDNVQIAYSITGHGTPLVKADNYLTHLEHDWNSPVWGHWWRELSATHQLIRYDARGSGLSDWNVETFNMDVWVRDLEAVVSALKLDRFALIGISCGAAVCIAFAVKYPELVSRLILYGGYARGRYHRDLDSYGKLEAEALINLIRVGWGKENPAFRQLFSTMLMPEADLEQIASLNRLAQFSATPETASKMERAFYQIDVRRLAPKVTTPTLILHPRQDALIPVEEGRLLATMIPDSRFVQLESRNHLLLEQEPAWNRFLAEVRSFLGVGADTSDQSPPKQPVFPELTLREREILELISQGLDNAQIAERLVVSQKTVRNHISHIFQKLAVKNRAQAIVLARQAGMGH
jgi:pimeloyl-ACP methyl ester carboxylesterase/DNA-binding CsgD family transcriptional regulator